jgi:hypothetical protein
MHQVVNDTDRFRQAVRDLKKVLDPTELSPTGVTTLYNPQEPKLLH